MALYFNPPKDGDKFANLGGSLENANSKLVFSEARVQKIDDVTYKLFMQLDEATDVTNISDKNWKFQPCLAAIVLHSTEYERNKKQGDNWVKEKCQPSSVEVFFCELFEKEPDLFLNDESAFKGTINLWDSPTTFQALRTGKQPDGSEIPESGLAFVRMGMYSCTSTEIDKLKELPAVQAKKNWGGGGKGQTEAERLKERHAALLQYMNEMCLVSNKQFETLSDIHAYLSDYALEPEKQSITALNLLRVVMG